MRLAVVLPLLLAACAKEPNREGEIAQLLPRDAQIVVRFSSIEDVDEWVSIMAPPFGPRSFSAYLPEPPKGARLLTDLPFGFAASFPGDGGRPQLAVALPSEDPAAFVAGAAKGDASRALERYAGLAEGPVYPEGGCAMWADLPDTDFFARVDIARLGGSKHPMVEEALRSAADGVGFAARMLPFGIAAEHVSRFEAWLREVLDSGERLDARFDLSDENRFLAEVAYVAREGTPFAASAGERGGLSGLAAHAVEGSTLVLLAHVDPGWLLGLAGAPALEGLSGDWLVSGKLDALGPEVVVATRASDAKGIAAVLGSLLVARMTESGFVFTSEKPEAPLDRFLCRIRIGLDAERFAARNGDERAKGMRDLLGSEGFVLDIAAKGDLLLVALGRDEGLAARLLEAKSPPKDLAALLSRLGGDVRFLAYCDIGASIDGVKQVATRVAGEDARKEVDGMTPDFGESALMEIYGVSAGRTWRWGLGMDREVLEAQREFMARRRFR